MTTKSMIKHKILSARPGLRRVNPPAFWFSAGFAVLNVILGIGVFLWEPTLFPVIAPNELVLHVWSGFFVLLGLGMMFSIATRRWDQIRYLMMAGMFSKVLWTIASLYRVNEGGTLIMAVFWSALGYFQALAIIFFFPPRGGLHKKDV